MEGRGSKASKKLGDDSSVEEVVCAKAAPVNLLDVEGQQEVKRRRQRPEQSCVQRAQRAVELHLTESELEVAGTRVNASGRSIYETVEKRLESQQGTNHNLAPSWWSKTLEEYGFGAGVLTQLEVFFSADAELDPTMKKAVDQPYAANPPDKKTVMLKSWLRTVDRIDDQDLHYILHRSVEQIGLSRSLSDQMLLWILRYFARIVCRKTKDFYKRKSKRQSKRNPL